MQSPRLRQLAQRNPYSHDNLENQYDIAIIGWWIAWIMTAYMQLMHTNNSIVLFESNRIAHGATGHNAGQVASYFEKPFDEIVAEYWYEQAWAGQEALIFWRELLEEILAQESIDINYNKSTGYVWLSSVEQIIDHLRRKHLRNAGSLIFDSILIADDVDISTIPHEYQQYISIVKKQKILELLQTKDEQYIAVWASTKWTINSALLCEYLADIICHRFPTRCSLLEHCHVETIDIHDDSITIHSNNIANPSYHCKHTILCTNGYSNFKIQSKYPIDKKFHNGRYGVLWYMIGAFTDEDIKPVCISYFPTQWAWLSSATEGDVYYYITARNFAKRWLICLWWPELPVDKILEWIKNHSIAKEEYENMLNFLYKTRNMVSIKNIDFSWHGLMWYTTSGIREIGQHPFEKKLRYNLWCNGVGICSSIYGAWKIMKQFQWTVFPSSIFDIR